jgi:hypothetical protein
MASPSPNMMPSKPRNTHLRDFEKTLAKKHSIASPTSHKIDRTSFSSVKENTTGVAQSFTDSKTSSYLRHEYDLNGSEDAILDDASSGSVTPVLEKRPGLESQVAMLNPQSTLHGLVCPCDGFRGWKAISIGGKTASKSFGDLRALSMRWEWDSKVQVRVFAPPSLRIVISREFVVFKSVAIHKSYYDSRISLPQRLLTAR